MIVRRHSVLIAGASEMLVWLPWSLSESRETQSESSGAAACFLLRDIGEQRRLPRATIGYNAQLFALRFPAMLTFRGAPSSDGLSTLICLAMSSFNFSLLRMTISKAFRKQDRKLTHGARNTDRTCSFP